MEILLFGVWIMGSLFASGSRYLPNLSVCLEDTDYAYACFVASSKSYNAAAYCAYIILGLAGDLAVLWFVSMVVVSVFIARHRRTGGHCRRERGPSV